MGPIKSVLNLFINIFSNCLEKQKKAGMTSFVGNIAFFQI